MSRDEYDAALHLLDRQIVDVDGMLVGKVDDLELTEMPDGDLVPTGLLLGAPALLPRFGGRLGAWLLARYVQIKVADGDRRRPAAIDFAAVAEVGSEVHLVDQREGRYRRRVDDGAGPSTRHTLGDLMGLRVELPERAGIGRTAQVIDARVTGPADEPGRQRVTALVVGRGRPGSMLGYERSGERGPWLVATVVRWLHRRTRLVRLGTDVEIDWAAGVVRIGPDADVRPFPIKPDSAPGDSR